MVNEFVVFKIYTIKSIAAKVYIAIESHNNGQK